MKLKKIIFITVGCIGLGLGAVGAVLPFLPAFPFLLLAAVCFAKSSERLSRWFVGTKLYKSNLETFVRGSGMTAAVKIRVMATVTVLMGIGFIMMSRVPVGRIVLASVWVFHLVYFIFFVRTCKSRKNLDCCRSVKICGMKNKKCAAKLEDAFNSRQNIAAYINFKSGVANIYSLSPVSTETIEEIITSHGCTVSV